MGFDLLKSGARAGLKSNRSRVFMQILQDTRMIEKFEQQTPMVPGGTAAQIPSNLEHERACDLGAKKEDDEGNLFYTNSPWQSKSRRKRRRRRFVLGDQGRLRWGGRCSRRQRAVGAGDGAAWGSRRLRWRRPEDKRDGGLQVFKLKV
jgi:hypothetical protein